MFGLLKSLAGLVLLLFILIFVFPEVLVSWGYGVFIVFLFIGVPYLIIKFFVSLAEDKRIREDRELEEHFRQKDKEKQGNEKWVSRTLQETKDFILVSHRKARNHNQIVKDLEKWGIEISKKEIMDVILEDAKKKSEGQNK